MRGEENDVDDITTWIDDVNEWLDELFRPSHW
jgi:hypothetical protein